jgi:hypothetical protein
MTDMHDAENFMFDMHERSVSKTLSLGEEGKPSQLMTWMRYPFAELTLTVQLFSPMSAVVTKLSAWLFEMCEGMSMSTGFDMRSAPARLTAAGFMYTIFPRRDTATAVSSIENAADKSTESDIYLHLVSFFGTILSKTSKIYNRRPQKGDFLTDIWLYRNIDF